jgi:hypothetical protein
MGDVPPANSGRIFSETQSLLNGLRMRPTSQTACAETADPRVMAIAPRCPQTRFHAEPMPGYKGGSTRRAQPIYGCDVKNDTGRDHRTGAQLE